MLLVAFSEWGIFALMAGLGMFHCWGLSPAQQGRLLPPLTTGSAAGGSSAALGHSLHGTRAPNA